MTENITALPIKREKASETTGRTNLWQPLESLREEVDRLFDDFGRGLWQPFGRSLFAAEPLLAREPKWATVPVVDVVEGEKAFELTAELPGIDEKQVEVKVVDGTLTIKGEKQEQKEEKKKDYYLQERRFGLFERSFDLPETVDADRIEAAFKKGVLTLTLPKKPEAQKPAKTIEVKAA